MPGWRAALGVGAVWVARVVRLGRVAPGRPPGRRARLVTAGSEVWGVPAAVVAWAVPVAPAVRVAPVLRVAAVAKAGLVEPPVRGLGGVRALVGQVVVAVWAVRVARAGPG